MTGQKKRIVIVGASSLIAQHCARRWVADAAVDLILVGRDQDKLDRIAADLQVRSPGSTISIVVVDFTDATQIGALAANITAQQPVDILLIAHGCLPDQAHCQTNLAACKDALLINGVSPALFAEAFMGSMQKNNRGTIALIGSVAGDRGRKSNYIYGAAKGFLERYTQGLQHRLAGSNVKVVLLKPGPTATPMTAHLKQQGMVLASVEEVASAIVVAIAMGSPVAYVPKKWAIIMLVVRHLPAFIFNRMNV